MLNLSTDELLRLLKTKRSPQGRITNHLLRCPSCGCENIQIAGVSLCKDEGSKHLMRDEGFENKEWTAPASEDIGVVLYFRCEEGGHIHHIEFREIDGYTYLN